MLHTLCNCAVCLPIVLPPALLEKESHASNLQSHTLLCADVYNQFFSADFDASRLANSIIQAGSIAGSLDKLSVAVGSLETELYAQVMRKKSGTCSPVSLHAILVW